MKRRAATLVSALLACSGDEIHFTPTADAALVTSIEGIYESGALRIVICDGADEDACTEGASADTCAAPCHHIRSAKSSVPSQGETLSLGSGCACSAPRADWAVKVDAAGTPMRGAVSTAPVAGDGYAGSIALRVHVEGAAAPFLTGEVRTGDAPGLLLRFQPIDPNGVSTADAAATLDIDGGLATWPVPNSRSLAFTKVAGAEACP